MQKLKYQHIAIVGATGRIGRDILNLIEETKFPFKTITALASKKSAGTKIAFGANQDLIIQDLSEFDFTGVDLAFFALDDSASLKYIPKALEKNVTVIDNSSVFRMKDNALLIVPEVNGEILDEAINDQCQTLLISNPNCCVIPLVMLLKSFENFSFKPIRMIVSTYQSVSGAGTEAMNELLANTKAKFGPGFNKKTKEESVFEYEIAFNCIPKIGSFNIENGYTSEEEKISQEPVKILANMPIFNDLQITATCVRVPVFVGHCLSVNIEFENLDPEIKFDLPILEEIIDSNDFIEFYSNESQHVVTSQDCIKRDETFACRLRLDPTVKNGINIFLVVDNLHKGGALNALQIAQRLIAHQN